MVHRDEAVVMATVSEVSKSPRRSQCSENRSLESGTNRLATGEPFREKQTNKQKNSCFLLKAFVFAVQVIKTIALKGGGVFIYFSFFLSLFPPHRAWLESIHKCFTLILLLVCLEF